MKFDSIISAFAMLLATGIGASYVPSEYAPSSYGMVKSPYSDNWEVIMIDENGQVQHPDKLPDWFSNGQFPGFPGQGQYPGQGQKPETSCPGTPPTENPEGEKPGDQTPPPSEKPEGQYPPTEKPGNQYPPTEKPGNQYPPTEKPGNQYPPNQKPGGQYPGGQYPPNQKPGGQYPGGQYPPTEKPGNQYPGGDEKPSPGGPAKGTCANIPADPGMDIQKMLKLVNEARKGLQPLKLNEALIKAAVYQSRNQQQMNRVSHDGPDGKDMGARMKECGLKGAMMMAENAASGTNEEGVMKMWMNSSGHRANIMNPSLKEFGAAKVGKYWTQTFSGSSY